MFLLYCAILGSSTFALIDLVVGLTAGAHGRWFDTSAPRQLATVALFSIADFFGDALARHDHPRIAGMVLALYVYDLPVDLAPAVAMAGVAAGSAIVLDALLRHLVDR